jgi:hypothetical protein
VGWFDAESQGVEQFRCCWVLAFCKQDHSHKSDYLHNQELLENQFYKSLSHNVLVQRWVYPILQTGAVVNQFVCLLREFLMKKIWNQSLQTWSCYSWSWKWVRRLSSWFAYLIVSVIVRCFFKPVALILSLGMQSQGVRLHLPLWNQYMPQNKDCPNAKEFSML